MEKGIQRLVEIIKEEGGERPLVFLDTGAVIQFESDLKMNENRNLDSTWLYSTFRKHFPVYISESAIAEMCMHHKHNRINGKLEIPDSTKDILIKFHEDYCNFLKQEIIVPLQFDKIRYDVLSAGQIAEKMRSRENLKKTNLEGLSRTDRSILETAGWLRYAQLPDGKDFTGSVILSTEALMRKTAGILCDKDYRIFEEFGKFGYSQIKVLDVNIDRGFV